MAKSESCLHEDFPAVLEGESVQHSARCGVRTETLSVGTHHQPEQQGPSHLPSERARDKET